MYYNAPLLYEQAYSITINNAETPLYYFFDYDERSYNINMEFQHFHQFYEVHILLDGKASHIIEGDYYALQPYDIVFLRPALLHKTEYPVGAPAQAPDHQFRHSRGHAVPGRHAAPGAGTL